MEIVAPSGCWQKFLAFCGFTNTYNRLEHESSIIKPNETNPIEHYEQFDNMEVDFDGKPITNKENDSINENNQPNNEEEVIENKELNENEVQQDENELQSNAKLDQN